ncbi:MAG: flavodoxin family protein [Syntrophorhabdaceae bacterium]|nr:flavodoxin family protein [Syntrophorhabdaceae bacterium]
MKVVAVLGSPRTTGNSSAIARRFMKAAAKQGAQTRTFELNQLTCRGCQGCYACKKEFDKCVLTDDLAEALSAVKDADIVVMASPIYFGDITAQLKTFIDRSFSYLKPDYFTNPQPSRLSKKKLVFVLSQGLPDEKSFSDVYPRYSGFLEWMGFYDSRLIRACGVGPKIDNAMLKHILKEAEKMAGELLA